MSVSRVPGHTTTVGVFVGTRADLGPLSPVLTALASDPTLELRVLTGVMYDAAALSRVLPPPYDESGWQQRTFTLAPPMDQLSVAAQLDQGAALAQAMGTYLREGGIDALVVLGDRWELMYVLPPAVLLGVPVVHLHGGEVTEGALDERVRHAVTKLADEHCVASEDSARRLRQLGEPDDRIAVTGAPGLDRLAHAEPLDAARLAALVGLAQVRRPVALFTYHPPTALAEADPGRWAREAAEATLAECATVIATYPGMDAGRDEIIESLSAVRDAHPDRFALLEALGASYPGVLASVDVVVGNSSSGVIEAATVHTPAVNIGERQRGRIRGANVLDSAEGTVAVAGAVRQALSPQWRAVTDETTNPYGDGTASEAIVGRVHAAVRTSRVKPFIDRACPAAADVTAPLAGEEGEP